MSLATFATRTLLATPRNRFAIAWECLLWWHFVSHHGDAANMRCMFAVSQPEALNVERDERGDLALAIIGE